MPSGWRERLSSLPRLDDPERIWRRVEQGPAGDGVPPAPQRGQRLVAASVAIAVFAGAAVFAFGALREDPAPLGDDTAPPEGALVATLDAPEDGSIPFMELRFDGETASIHPQGGEWPGGPDAWTAELQSAPAELPLGTPIAFVGDIAEVDVTIRYGLSGDRPIEPLEDSLPDVPGDYVVEVLGTWPQGTAAFTFSVHVRDPHAVYITWSQSGGDVPFVHARYQDEEVELNTMAGEGNMVAILEEAMAELTVPAGTDVWVSGEATLLDASLSSGRQTIPFEPVSSPLPAAMVRDVEPGRHTIGVRLETAQGPSASLLVLRVEGSDASSEPPPTTAVITVDLDHPIRVVLTYDGQEQRATIEDTWKPVDFPDRDPHPPCDMSTIGDHLLVVPPATHVEVVGDADRWWMSPPPNTDGRLPSTSGPVTWTFRGANEDLAFDACFSLFVGEPGVPVPVPDLVGKLDQGAFEALAGAGFLWELELVHASDEPQWRVLRTEPAAGTYVLPNTAVRIVVATTITPMPAGADDALACEPDDRIPIAGPHFVVLPSGEAFIRGNVGGIRGSDEVVDAEGPGSGDEGLWHVVRDGEVIAVVDYGGLDGVACRGSGIAGA